MTATNPLSITVPGIIIAILFVASIVGTLNWMVRLPEVSETAQRAARAVRATAAAVKILIPIHGGALSERLVALGCQMAKQREAEIYLLFVKEIPRLLPLDAEIPEQTVAAQEAIQRAEAIAERLNQKLNVKVVHAREAGSAIVREAYEANVDIILMGAGAKPKEGAFSLGDAAAAVLRNAPCEVLLARAAP